MTRTRARGSIRAATPAISGVGLHSGAATSLRFLPAEAGTGIVFRRVDGVHDATIPATVDNVREVDHRTVLGTDGASIQTVEHVLAAVAAHQIDDIIIEVDGPESPIMDGSAEPFFSALGSAGVDVLPGTPALFELDDPVTLRVGDSTYRACNGERTVSVKVHWDHPAIGTQAGSFDLTPLTFSGELAGARTFGFLRDEEELRRRGLIKGASRNSVVVLSDTDVVTGPLRWPDEFLRHKAVDLLGDLALLGGLFCGTIEASSPSHRGNVTFARAILSHCTKG